jgi:type I restriction enzyme, S subunit
MKLEAFFEKFDQFADMPDAVPKMRELLVHFAVVGKLVPNDPKEKPVGLTLSGASESESPFPANWREGFLRDAFNFEYGDNLPAPKRSQSGEYPVYGSNGIVGTHVNYLTKEPAIIVGRKGSAGALNIANGPSWTTDVAYFVRPPKDIDLRFTYYLFSTLRLDALGKGIKPGLSRKEAYALPIALPPLAEQKRIVAKVDELMALCDRLEAQQQERETQHAALARASLARFVNAPTPANLQFLFQPSYTILPTDLRKSILTLAVQGKLVPQDPIDAPATDLLAQISRKKKAMIEAKHVRQGKVSRPQSALDAPTELPRGWEWVNVDSLCFKVTDGTHFTPQYAAAGVRFVSAKDIVSGKLVFDRCKFITQEEHDQLYRRCNPEYHDIVISKSGSIGTVALVEDRDEFSLFESLALLKFDQESLFPAFLVCALTHACASLTTGHIRGVGVKHLHLDILRGLEMALPPLAEQRRIVAKVTQLMALVDKLETQLTASRAIAANLLSALVAELTGTMRDGKVAAPRGGAVRRGRPKESQPEIAQATS